MNVTKLELCVLCVFGGAASLYHKEPLLCYYTQYTAIYLSYHLGSVECVYSYLQFWVPNNYCVCIFRISPHVLYGAVQMTGIGGLI